jgi:hypothetical protein
VGARGLILGGVLLVAAVVPAAVQAQDKVCVSHPAAQDDSVACVRDKRIVDVCDRKEDGHRAYARVVTVGTYPAYRSPYYDSNNANPGCSNLNFGQQVYSVSICVQTKGCSAFKRTGVPPPSNTSPTPTPAPPAPTPTPTPAPPPPAPPQTNSGVGLGVGLDCAPRGKRMPVSLSVHKRKGKAKPRVKRVVFYYRKKGGVVARSDRKRPYKRTLRIHLAPGPHHVYARVYYKRPGSKKLRKETVKRRFTVCA